MDDESDTSDNVNPNMFGDSSSVERIKNDYGALRCILSKMEFGDLLNARLVCRNWKKESDFFIRRRIKAVDLTTDCRLKEYLQSDRTVYPSIKLDVGGLSTEVLAKCDLGGIQELLIKTTGPKSKGYGKVIASDIWLEDLKNKFMKLFEQENNLTSLHMDLTYPITFTGEEYKFVNYFASIRSLSFELGWKCDLKNFEANGIGSILVSRCSSVKYLTLKQQYNHPIFNLLVNMLNERTTNLHAMPTLSIQPEIRVGSDNFRQFTRFANLGLRFEILELLIECENEDQFIEVIRATEKLLRSTADFLRELHLNFYRVEGITSQPRITIPSLPNLENLEIGARIRHPFQFIQLPDKFPCLKKLQFLSNWDTFSISGKVFPNLDKLLIGCDDFFYIPDSPPAFPDLRTIDFGSNTFPVTEAFLRYAFTHFTLVRNMSIQLPHIDLIVSFDDEEYFDAWNIFTGGAQPPDYVLPPVNVNDLLMDEAENDIPGQVADAVNDEVNVNDGNPASLENFTNLRELQVYGATPRVIQAITYMTESNKMQKLVKLRIYKYPRDKNTKFDDFPRCLDILQGYHCHVEIR